jgi:hypothetical protein
MIVVSPVLDICDSMLKQQVSSYRSAGQQSIYEMKARQAAKIREIGAALVTAGATALDAQAKMLGLSRSTVWTIVNGSHKNNGLSAKVIKRILVAPDVAPLVRAKVIQYAEEKAAGRYGHNKLVRRKFLALLLTNPHEKNFAQASGGRRFSAVVTDLNRKMRRSGRS